MLANLKGIFSPEAVAASLKTLPVLKTTIMDSLFKQRPTHPLPMIGVSDLVSVAQTVPVVRRDLVTGSDQTARFVLYYYVPKYALEMVA